MKFLNWFTQFPILIKNSSYKKNLCYALAITLFLITIGNILWKGHNQTQTVTTEIPLVRTSTISAADATHPYTYSGEVRGRYESKLSFQVSGKLTKRNIELGSIVNAGDVLMQIDPKDIQQLVNSSSAQVNAAESQLNLAASNLNRYRQLYNQNAISRAQLDQYQNAYELAQASLQQASAQYSQGANQLDYSLLRADKPGIISSISAETGQIVSAGQSVLTLVYGGEQEIEISIPENRIEEIRNAKQFKVTFWALENIIVDGKIREIAPMADQLTRTYKARITLINPPPQIKLGMTATVATVDSNMQKNSIITIPLSAIYQTNDTPGVWIVTENMVNLRPIQIGNFGDGKIQVLFGLKPKEVIVTAGVHKLHEGQKVRILDGDRP